MAAAATDYFIKVKENFSTTIGAGGVADGTTATIPLTSVTGLPTDTAIELVINRVDTAGTETNNYETVRGVISGSNLTTSVRGVEGTAQAWTAGKVVEYLVTADIQNRMVTGLLVDHDQSGYHKSLTDANGNEWIKQTATASAVNELTIANAATGNAPTLSATGDDTNIDLALAPKGTGALTVPAGTYEDNVTADDDIPNKAYVDNIVNKRALNLYVIDATTDTSTGDGKMYFTIPSYLNTWILKRVHGRVITAGTTNTTDIQLHNVTDAVDMLSTKLTIDSGETGSDTAASAAVIDAANDDVATNDLIRVDIDAVSTTAAKGLILTLEFEDN